MQDSVSLLFDRLIHRAFRDKPDLVVDENAPLVVATSELLRGGNFRPHLAFSHVSALRLFHEAGIFVRDHNVLHEKYGHLVQIENRLFARNAISEEMAVLIALEWIKAQSTLPEFCDSIAGLSSKNVYDFSEAKLQIILRLAELGLPINFQLPFDSRARGLLLPVQKTLEKIESRPNARISIDLHEVETSVELKAFYHSIFNGQNNDDKVCGARAIKSSTFSAQAEFVSGEIMRLRRESAEPVSTAIVFRTLDSRVKIFEEALRGRDLSYKVVGKLALSELPATKLILRDLKEKLDAEQETKTNTISWHLDNISNNLTDKSLRNLFNFFAKELRGESLEIDLRSFYHWLCFLSNKRLVNFLPDENADATEIISVKQISSKKYDYVFLVDLAQGRFPKTDFNSTLNDTELHEINKLMRRPIMRVDYDDPLEPSLLHSRFGFESLRFVNTISSAQRQLYLCASSLDPSGRDQGPSEYFLAATKIVNEETVDTKTRNLAEKIESVEAGKGFAGFEFDNRQSKKLLAPWLGLDRSRPLTASRLEGFAACPFRFMVERVFGIEDENRYKGDIDPRLVGKFVHAVLEKFFRDYRFDRRYLKQIIEKERWVLNQDEETPREIINAHVLWLTLILERCVSNLLKNQTIGAVSPTYFEHKIGFEAPLCKMDLGPDEIYLAGIVDRIDVGSGAIAIVDYKMSSAVAVRKRASAAEMFQSHFQLPLYARLVLEQIPEARDKEIFAYFVSIRDGVISSVLGGDIAKNFKELVSCDEREDGLAQSIHRVMKPLLLGKFAAKRNPSCDYCHLKSVCRIQVAHVEDNDSDR